MRILIVDDSKWMRDKVRGAVEGWAGAQVVGEAADGREAIAQAEALQPSAIIMDHWLPNLKGLEASRYIHAKWPAIRIIMHSSSGIAPEEARFWGAETSVPKEHWRMLQQIIMR
jgi:DNA-binding NarL/FixJ family response regulator